ncbi:[Pyruvate dehydrogenase [lipoamide]] kinase, mitochondrial [Glycine soja]|uniref:Protein-serine/threonine kinase n=1 Tax=Glycine soja TaxID=3848 RepID=A0A0B2RKV1_GLYSO|nr:[Pyruvate dehydrogenase [lipoamide]] kinase, mitochondrial [Glycine soja]
MLDGAPHGGVLVGVADKEFRTEMNSSRVSISSSEFAKAHLHLMVFELVKNSLRAVQERFMDSDEVAPPIRIIIADGIEDVTIKVSDEGGGIPRSGLPRIFTYLYSTAGISLSVEHELSDIGTMENVTMAGYGYGLPICRLYASIHPPPAFGSSNLEALALEANNSEEDIKEEQSVHANVQ